MSQNGKPQPLTAADIAAINRTRRLLHNAAQRQDLFSRMAEALDAAGWALFHVLNTANAYYEQPLSHEDLHGPDRKEIKT